MRYRAVIVGAGPAGTATAIAAARRNPACAERLLLLDSASSFPRHKLCGGGVTALADGVLNRLALDDPPPAAPVRRVNLKYGKVHATFEHDSMFFQVFDRSLFDDWLFREARELGIPTALGERALNVELHTSHAVVNTSRRRLAADLIVAADGANGQVRRSLGVGDSPLARLVEAVMPAPADGFDVATFDLSGLGNGLNGYGWTFPMPQSTSRDCKNVGLYDSRLGSCDEPVRLRTRLRSDLGTEGTGTGGHVTIASWPIRLWHDGPVTVGSRVLLTGDAAGVDPLLGEGISWALRYGELAGEVLADTFTPLTTVVRRYEDAVAREIAPYLARRRRWAIWLYRHGSITRVPTSGAIRLLSAAIGRQQVGRR